MSRPKNIDAYIAQQEPFAQELLAEARNIVHQSLPAIEERIKWGAPSYEQEGLLLTTVAFKDRVAFWFHKGSLLTDPNQKLEASSKDTKAMRKYEVHRGSAIDADQVKKWLVEAAALNQKGVEIPKEKKKLRTSERLHELLEANPEACKFFQELSIAKRNEYADYILEAKREDTIQRRLKKSLDLLNKHQGLNDRYRS